MLIYIISNNLGCLLLLILDECVDLQILWNDVCCCIGVVNNCVVGCGNVLIVLNLAELVWLQVFLLCLLCMMELDGIVFDMMLDMIFGVYKLIVGGQYIDIDMIDGVFGMDGNGYQDNVKQKYCMLLVFVEDNWLLIDMLIVIIGLCYDYYNIFGSYFSLCGYLVWNVSDVWIVKGGVSIGYKILCLDQLFFGVIGFGGQGVLLLVGLFDFKLEISINYELVVYYEGVDWGFNVIGFFNQFDDKIVSGGMFLNCEVVLVGGGYCVDVGLGWVELGYSMFIQSVNVDKVEIKGVEVVVYVDLLDNLQLCGNYIYICFEQISGVDKGKLVGGIMILVCYMVNVSLNWQFNDVVSLLLIGEGCYDCYCDMLVISVGGVSILQVCYYEDYIVFYFGGSWIIILWLIFNVCVNNLFDKDFVFQLCVLISDSEYNCVDDYVIKDQCCSYWMLLNVRF